MDILYIPQLDDADAAGGEGPTTRYRLLKRIAEENAPQNRDSDSEGRSQSDGEAGLKAPRSVALQDRAMTRIEVTAGDPLRLVVPPLVKGQVRDFFVRLVITADEVPEITFAAPSGETISFEDIDEDVFKCEIGVNVFAFTETDQGIFIVNRKQIDIDQDVMFDPCEGELDKTTYTFKLGAQYSSLPKPTRSGYTFLGWYTEAEEGIEVKASDSCKTGVTKLYAHWEIYVDPFVDAICPAHNLTFHSESAMPWLLDSVEYATEPASARSGAIGDNGSTSITTAVQGKGTFSFKWKVSSEDYYDFLRFSVDGSEKSSISGQHDWANFTQTIATDGTHQIEWKYTKDGSSASGNDSGWIDEIVWTPEG